MNNRTSSYKQKLAHVIVAGCCIVLLNSCAWNQSTVQQQTSTVAAWADGTVRSDTHNQDVARLWSSAEKARRAGQNAFAVDLLYDALEMEPRNAVLWSRAAELQLDRLEPALAEDHASRSNVFAVGNDSLLYRNWLIIEYAREMQGDLLGVWGAHRKVLLYKMQLDQARDDRLAASDRAGSATSSASASTSASTSASASGEFASGAAVASRRPAREAVRSGRQADAQADTQADTQSSEQAIGPAGTGVVGQADEPAGQARERMVAELSAELKFDTGLSDLNREARLALTQVVDHLRRYPDTIISVEGHTDNIGSAADNLQLSTRRVVAVARYLIDNGLSTQQFRLFSYGESRPRASNLTAAGREQNRRIEINVVEGLL